MGAGTQKIELGRRGDTDYESKKGAALAQAKQNAFMMGIQDVYFEGAGTAAAADRSALYGDTPIKTTPVMQGMNSAAAGAPGQNAGNSSMYKPAAQSGALGLGSSTMYPQEATMGRIAKMAAGGYGDPGLNDRSKVMRA